MIHAAQDLKRPIAVESVFRLHTAAIVESFETGTLVLHSESRNISELNASAYWVLTQTDGQQSVARIADNVALTFEVSATEALSDILSLYTELLTLKLIELVEDERSIKEMNTMVGNIPLSTLFIRNPDVGLREEEADGCLLFNPDTNQVQVLNATGLFIWQQCNGTATVGTIIDLIKEAFDEVPEEQVFEDVQQFLNSMNAQGFLGSVEFKQSNS